MRVRVLVPLDPWRLALSLDPVRLSARELVAVCARPPADVRALFQEGDPYELQLEPGGDELAVHGVKARLAKLSGNESAMELTFSFTEMAAGLDDLVRTQGDRVQGGHA